MNFKETWGRERQNRYTALWTSDAVGCIMGYRAGATSNGLASRLRILGES